MDEAQKKLEKKAIIKKMKKAFQKSVTKMYSLTFDQNIRNKRYFEMLDILDTNIKKLELM